MKKLIFIVTPLNFQILLLILLESFARLFTILGNIMKLEKIDENTFNLRGKLKDFSDYSELKSILEKKRKKDELEVFFSIPNAREINFYILGYWLKLARKNNFKFHIRIKSPYLYNNFLKLGLHNFFEVINGNME